MVNKLKEIKLRKEKEVALFKRNLSLADPISEILENGSEYTGFFKEALRKKGLSIIAEIKRKSPSAGMIKKITDPTILAKRYEEGGASAISVLTDFEDFGGMIEDLNKVSHCVKIPILRKDFIIDPVQIAEAIHYNASAVLLIVALVGEKVKTLLQECDRLGIDALVEVHNQEELALALEGGATMIGVNNRNLKTFEVDLQVAEDLALLIPEGVLKVAESGIRTKEDALRMKDAGYDALLIGEALVKADKPSKLLREIA